MDWRERIKTQPYLFHLEVPHIKAGETALVDSETGWNRSDGDRAAESKGNAGVEKKKINQKQIQLEAVEVVRKFRRESLGIVMPDDVALTKGGRGNGNTDEKKGMADHSRKDTTSSNSSDDGIRIMLTYADLVKTALDDLFQKRRISVPVWCEDTSHEFGRGGSLANASETEKDDEVKNNGSASSSTLPQDFVKHSMVTFTSEYPELVKQRLAVNIGLGTKVGCLNMIPITICKRADNNYAGEVKKDNDPMIDSSRNVDPGKDIAQGGFFASIQARLVVEQVVEGVRNAATFSFDYLCLVIVASMLAAVGLASNNTVVIVASMLVSPIMGPILAITFGTMVENKELVHMGLINEAISLLICIFVGFVIAWIFIACDAHNEWTWPTAEMGGRGTIVGILTGIAIATPSGVGVALSILSNNTSSLVGVAISASLLPPAVNAGMMWAYAIFCESSNQHVPYIDSKHYVGVLTNETGNNLMVVPINGRHISWAGLVSLLLTLLNIAIILVTACAMFWFKSVVKYDGEGAEWSNEFKKYKAANYVVKNDGEGRLLAEKAKWVAKFGRGHAKVFGHHAGTSAKQSRCKPSSCCSGSEVQKQQAEKIHLPALDAKGKPIRGRRISMPMAVTGLTNMNTTKPEASNVQNVKTPVVGARPDALSLFEAPSLDFASPNGGLNQKDAHAKALAIGVLEGHKTLTRMLSVRGTSSKNLRSASSLTVTGSSQRMPGVKTPVTLETLNSPKSLFRGRRARHAEQKFALSKTIQTIHAMQAHSAHNRAISHSQYGQLAMAGLFDAPGE